MHYTLSEVIAAGLPAVSSSMPVERLSIEHQSGKYILNDLPLEGYHNNVIMLGAILQRVMWPPRDESGAGASMECQSRDGALGHPTRAFPLEDDGNIFDAARVTAAMAGVGTLDCASCLFSEWRSEMGRARHPRCTVQVTVPCLVPRGPEGETTFRLAAVSYQRTAEKPIREYMREFTKRREPAYSVFTRLKLNVNLGKGFKYSTPTFSQAGDIGEELFPTLSALYAAAKETLTAPPTPALPKSGGGMLSVGVTPQPGKPPTHTGSFFG